MVKLKTQEELEEDLCEYCPLEKKGVYSTPGGKSIGCEGSHCDEAYSLYLEYIEENNSKGE